MLKIKTCLPFFAVIFFCAFNAFAQKNNAQSSTLTYDEYISQVKGQSIAYDAANQSVEAYENLKKKSKLVTAVNFFATTQNGFVEQNQALQIVRYTNVYNRNSQLGVTQTSDFGLSTKLYYSINHVTYKGLNTTNYPNPSMASSNYQSIPAIEVSLPLWQNRFGSATKASIDATYYSNESQKLTAKSVSINSLVTAEQSYWGLVTMRRVVEIQKAALSSAEQILEYVSKKERMNLGEKGDVLQARALLELRKLSLKQAENDEILAARDFNKQRYIDSFEVTEKLAPFDLTRLRSYVVPKVKGDDRFDVKAYEANMKAAAANAKIDEEANKPSLSLYGSYLQNQIQPGITDAINTSLNKNGRAGTVGLKFSMPINFSTLSDIRAGDRQSVAVAKANYRQKIFEQENEWQNLVQNLEILKINIGLAQAMETAQKAKLENERKLLKQGRTTTYQILLFEQDFSNSQITTVQLAYRMLLLIAQQKLYEKQ